MTLIYIHGAASDSTTFDFLQSHLAHPRPRFFDYTSQDSFRHNLVAMRDQLLSIPGQIDIVAHSLGGIYAAHLLESHGSKIRQVVSLSTPFNGSEFANWIRLAAPKHPLFEDIAPNSWPISHLRGMKITTPWTQIVSVHGNVPWFLARNDGVVTHRSMTSRDDVEYVEVKYDHYDIVQAPDVADLIAQKLSLI